MEILAWPLIGAIIGYMAPNRRGFSPVAGISDSVKRWGRGFCVASTHRGRISKFFP